MTTKSCIAISMEADQRKCDSHDDIDDDSTTIIYIYDLDWLGQAWLGLDWIISDEMRLDEIRSDQIR